MKSLQSFKTKFFNTLLVLFVVFMFIGCDENSGSEKDDIAQKEVDSNGAVVSVPFSDPLIGGVELEVPFDALDNPTVISIQAIPTDSNRATPRKWAEAEPELHLAVVEYALAHLEDATMHPLYGPLFALSSAEFAGPGIELGPSGQEFNKPVTLTIPIEVLGLTDEDTENVLPMIQSHDGRWEVIEDFYIDDVSGLAVVEVSHFSLLKWLKNFIAAPENIASIYASGAVQNASAQLPQDTFNEFVAGVVCSGEEPSADLSQIPGLPTLLDYLGFEAGALRSGQEAALTQWIRDKFQEAQAGVLSLNSISLGEIFRQSLELNGGDIFQALVTAHNALRDNRNSPSVQNMIENYRGDGGDERGARYHLFGMALYSFAYEYFLERTNIVRNSGKLVIGTEALDPRVVATIEESIVSGDIVSDVTEYAVDLQGAEIGRQLYKQVRNSQIADLVSQFGIDPADCDQPLGASGWAVYRITNYGSAPGGYITVAEVGIENNPPRISSYPGGGRDPVLRAVFERIDASAAYATPDDAAKSVCGRVKDFFRPALASFIQMAYFDGVKVGIDTIFKRQCE